MSRLFFPLLICTPLFIISCVSSSKLEKYASAAKEQDTRYLVVLNTGEVIKGDELRRPVTSKKWTIGGKSVDMANVVAYQVKQGYFEKENARIIKGKISLFWVRGGQASGAVGSSADQTRFILKHPDGKTEWVSYNVFRKAVQDCPAALRRFESVFTGTYTKTHPDWLTNDYPKLIEVLDVYNSSCPK